MTQADIEVMLTNLAETTRYVRESSRLIRAAAEQIVTVNDHLAEVITRIDAAITAGRSTSESTSSPDRRCAVSSA